MLLLLFRGAPPVTQQGGGYGFNAYDRFARRRRREREELEQAIDEEIAALLAPEPVPAPRAEDVGRQYVAELRAYLEDARARDAQFRAFLERQQLTSDATLADLLRIERAIRTEVARRRRDEDEFLTLIAAA